MKGESETHIKYGFYRYKLNTNFFENSVDKGFQNERPIEWE